MSEDEKTEKFILKLTKADLKKDGIIIARGVQVRVLNNAEIKLKMTMGPTIEPNLLGGSCCLVFYGGYEQKINITSSLRGIASDGKVHQVVEGYIC